MRNMVMSLLLFALMIAHPAQTFAQSPRHQETPPPPTGIQGKEQASWVQSTAALSAGYRKDNLNWNIAGNREGGNPNVLSELNWSGVTIYQLKLTSHMVIKDWIYLKGQLDYGMVVSGDNQDSDYLGDNRTQEFSRSVNGVDGNKTWDGALGVGPRFSFLESTVILCPMLGYAIAEQDFTIVDGYQVLSAPPVSTATGPIDGLDSRYQTRWDGPWVGIDLLLSMPVNKGSIRRVGVMVSGAYHWVDYSADANWNLRTDLAHPVSFSHDAQGQGVTVGATIGFQTNNQWGVNIGMHMQEMTTEPGVDRVYQADGTVSETRLNEVSWRSFTFEAGLAYHF